MTQSKISEYLQLQRDFPHLFPEGAPYEILRTEADAQAAQEGARSTLRARGLPETWEDVGICHRDRFLVVLRDPVRFPDGSLSTLIRAMPPFERDSGSAVLPMLGGQVVLIRIYRHCIGSWTLEIPRGALEAGETAEETARREIREEIGGELEDLISLGQSATDGGLMSHRNDLFFARLREGSTLRNSDPQEAIAGVVLLSPAEVRQAIARGEIFCGITLAAHAKASARGLLG